MGRHDAALLADHASLTVFDLPLAALTAQLAHGFDHKLGAGHTRFRQKPAGSIGWQAAANLSFPRKVEIPARAPDSNLGLAAP